MAASWNVARYIVVEIDRRFGGAYCLYHHGYVGGSDLLLKRQPFYLRLPTATSQKTVFFSFKIFSEH
jgi:hypothetical protein